MNRWQLFLSLILLLILFLGLLNKQIVSHIWAQEKGWAKIPTVALVAPDKDPRIQLVYEAIEFWNQMFAEIKILFRFGSVIHTTAEVAVTDLEMLSTKVLNTERISFPSN